MRLLERVSYRQSRGEESYHMIRFICILLTGRDSTEINRRNAFRNQGFRIVRLKIKFAYAIVTED